MRGAGADGTRRCVWSVMWSYRGIIHVFRRALPVVIVVFVTTTPFVASASVLLLLPWAARARLCPVCARLRCISSSSLLLLPIVLPIGLFLARRFVVAARSINNCVRVFFLHFFLHVTTCYPCTE